MPASRLGSRNSRLFSHCGTRQDVFYKKDRRLTLPSLLCISILLILLFSVYPAATASMLDHSSSSASSASGDGFLGVSASRPPPHAASRSKASAAPPSVPPVLSLAKACRTEIQLYCGNSSLHPLQCLLEHYYAVRDTNAPRMTDVYSELCHTWLNARDVCVTSLRQHWDKLCGDEGYAMNVRECLRRVPPPLLPEACRESDYYHSVRLAGRLRQTLFDHARESANMEARGK